MSYILIALFFLLLGFAAGRRTGITEGKNLGKYSAYLELLGESLDKGSCAICQKSLAEKNGSAKIAE